jgi:hypothetical protein
MAFPGPAGAYFRPLRDQMISAVSRPTSASRSFTSKRIIDPPFCFVVEGPDAIRAFPFEALVLRPETSHPTLRQKLFDPTTPLKMFPQLRKQCLEFCSSIRQGPFSKRR